MASRGTYHAIKAGTAFLCPSRTTSHYFHQIGIACTFLMLPSALIAAADAGSSFELRRIESNRILIAPHRVYPEPSHKFSPPLCPGSALPSRGFHRKHFSHSSRPEQKRPRVLSGSKNWISNTVSTNAYAPTGFLSRARASMSDSALASELEARSCAMGAAARCSPDLRERERL